MMVDERLKVMKRNEQLINYLSISVLDEVGINEPTQMQLDCLEACVSESLQWMSLAIFVLARAGHYAPSVERVKKVAHEISQHALL